MKRSYSIFLILCCISTLTSCISINKLFNSEFEQINGSKNVVEISRDLDRFHTISLDNFDVVLIQDTVNKIRLTGEDNVLDEIHTYVENGQLKMKFTPHRGIKLHTQPKFYVHFTNIEKIEAEQGKNYTSEGTITLDKLIINSRKGKYTLNLNVEVLEAKLSGSLKCGFGFIQATGRVGKSNILLVGAGRFDSPELSGDVFQLSYEEDSYYRIKLKNFTETNLHFPTNKIAGPNPHRNHIPSVPFL